MWEYRTILFEFTKDGLLSDKYVDDEEIEKNLNLMGQQGWELISVSLLQDGLLAFLKRALQEEKPLLAAPSPKQQIIPSATPAPSIALTPPTPAARPKSNPPPINQPIRPLRSLRSPISAEHLQEEERENNPIMERLERPRRSVTSSQDDDLVGGIRIS